MIESAMLRTSFCWTPGDLVLGRGILWKLVLDRGMGHPLEGRADRLLAHKRGAEKLLGEEERIGFEKEKKRKTGASVFRAGTGAFYRRTGGGLEKSEGTHVGARR